MKEVKGEDLYKLDFEKVYKFRRHDGDFLYFKPYKHIRFSEYLSYAYWINYKSVDYEDFNINEFYVSLHVAEDDVFPYTGAEVFELDDKDLKELLVDIL